MKFDYKPDNPEEAAKESGKSLQAKPEWSNEFAQEPAGAFQEELPNKPESGFRDEFAQEPGVASPVSATAEEEFVEKPADNNEMAAVPYSDPDNDLNRSDDAGANEADFSAGGLFDEEFSAEVASPAIIGAGNGRLNNPEEDRPDTAFSGMREDANGDIGTAGKTIGWIALALSIVSLFIYPVMMGATAVVLGIIAYMQGRRTLGAWSVVIGGIALISYFVLVPYYT